MAGWLWLTLLLSPSPTLGPPPELGEETPSVTYLRQPCDAGSVFDKVPLLGSTLDEANSGQVLAAGAGVASVVVDQEEAKLTCQTVTSVAGKGGLASSYLLAW